MKIYARQVPPEFQAWPFDYIDIQDAFPGVIFHGNRFYNSHTTPEFDAIYNRFDDEKSILRALHLVTGRRYEKRTIRGSCQGDWQNIYYPVADYTREALDILETEYFNTGTEWIIHDGDSIPENPDDIDGFSIYCHGWSDEQIRTEIADAYGTQGAEVIRYKFTGWSRSAQYEEA